MTQEEKRALIAEKLEGIRFAEKLFDGRGGKITGYRMQFPDGTPVHSASGGTWGWGWHSEKSHDWPGYDLDLNLCARVEAKIAERELRERERYVELLWFRWFRVIGEGGGVHFRFLTAPASARVDAMVALIQELGL